MTAPTGLLVVTALRSERAALARHVPGARVERCGMGPARARAWLPRLAELDPEVLVVAGVAGGLHPALVSGDVVVATEVRDARDPAATVALPPAAALVGDLRRLGLRVHTGPVLSCDHLVSGRERLDLAATGALAVDMESAAVLDAPSRRPHRPAAVVRVIVDTAQRPLAGPGTVTAGLRALRILRRVGPAFGRWAGAVEIVQHVVARENLVFALPGEVVEQWESR